MSMTFRLTPRAVGHRVLSTVDAVAVSPAGVQVQNVPGDVDGFIDTPLTGHVLLVGRVGLSSRGYELSHDGEAYTVRVHTPASRQDWRMALDHVAALARHLDAAIVDENGVQSTPETVVNFPFEQDIAFGLQQLGQAVQAQGEAVIPGLVRPVVIDQQMVEVIHGADPAARFEAVMRVVQDEAAHDATQQILMTQEDQLIGAYQLTQGRATILPLRQPRLTPANQQQLRGREVSGWWLILVTLTGGDPTDRGSYKPIARIPYQAFLGALPKGKGRKIDAATMVVEPLGHDEIVALAQASLPD